MNSSISRKLKSVTSQVHSIEPSTLNCFKPVNMKFDCLTMNVNELFE